MKGWKSKESLYDSEQGREVFEIQTVQTDLELIALA